MLTNTRKELERFARNVVSKSRSNLTRQNKNASRELWESIRSELDVHKQSFSLSFFMEDYGDFQDRGVTGKNASGFKGKNKKVHKSLSGFRFGSGNFKGKGEQWEKRIDKWMFSRGIAPRDKATGKFLKRSSVNFLIRRSIFQHGIKPSMFFTKPFEAAFKNFPDELIESFGLDVEELLKSTTDGEN